MFNTLYIKLSALLVLLFVLIGVLLYQLTRYSTDMYYQEITQRLNAPVAMYVANEAELIDHAAVNAEALKSLAYHAMIINPSVEVYLLDPQGGILAHALEPDSVVRKQVDLQPVGEFFKNDSHMPILGDDPRSDNRKIFSVSEVRNDGVLEGYVYIILGGRKYEQLANSAGASQVLRLSTMAVMGCLLFGLGSALLIFAGLSRRLRRLTTKADRFWSKETGDDHANRSRQDEIMQLDKAFDAMQARIEQQLQQIQQTDQTRRELITNISHDLRTPLTSMQGYIETLLLKDDAISDAQRREYLEIARNHAQRLGRLIADLFELAKLDSQAVKPQLERFSLAELVHDITQDFSLIAGQKHIQLGVEANNPELQVYADIRLIERVFENLLENALRYTPEYGRIVISLENHNDGVRVKVTDNGAGIAEQTLPHIFDRYFHFNETNAGHNQSTGLGLAIVKRILELHNTAISVSSKIKKGTEFVFVLQGATPELQT